MVWRRWCWTFADGGPQPCKPFSGDENRKADPREAAIEEDALQLELEEGSDTRYSSPRMLLLLFSRVPVAISMLLPCLIYVA